MKFAYLAMAAFALLEPAAAGSFTLSEQSNCQIILKNICGCSGTAVLSGTACEDLRGTYKKKVCGKNVNVQFPAPGTKPYAKYSKGDCAVGCPLSGRSNLDKCTV